MPSNPVWRCLAPGPGSRPCEAGTPVRLSCHAHGVLSLSPCFLGTSISLRPVAHAAPHPQPFESALHASSPGEEEKKAQAAHRPGTQVLAGSDLRHLPSRLPGPQPALASAESALSGAVPRPPPEETALCARAHTVAPSRGQPLLLPRGLGLPVSGTAVRV